MVDFKKLSAPFSPDEVSWRVGSMTKDKSKGMALCYIDARVAMDRLDDVCGPDGWQAKYSHVGTTTVCDIGIRCDNEWLWKADGAGQSDIEAEKGSLSDAFKRAAVRWGIGRYLYDLPSPWVELDEWKHIKTAEYKKLDQILRQHTQRILNPPSNTERGATNALSSAKDDIARMNNEKNAKNWQVVNPSDEPFKEGILDLLDVAQSPDDVSAIMAQNADRIAVLSPERKKAISDAEERLLRWFEKEAAGSRAA